VAARPELAMVFDGRWSRRHSLQATHPRNQQASHATICICSRAGPDVRLLNRMLPLGPSEPRAANHPARRHSNHDRRPPPEQVMWVDWPRPAVADLWDAG
jgi:hypothetical protein